MNPTKLETTEQIIGRYDLQVAGIARGYKRTGEADAQLKQEALGLVKDADVVLYYFGLDELSESEGLDRVHMRIPKVQVELLEEMAKINPNIVGVMSAGASVEMPWEGACKAILHGYLNGQAGAGGMLDILTGKVNPSGKLNETYPLKYGDTPARRNFPSKERNSEYREGIFVGYRYYDTAGVRVRYPFGYGLSYTTFVYSDLRVNDGGVTFKVTNTGNRAGAEVAQLYVGMKGGKVFRPAKELKGFAKVFLKAGESEDVTISFDDKTFRYWNVKTDAWETEGGAYQVMVGANVADIRLETEVAVAGTVAECPYDEVKLPSYYKGTVQDVPDEEFAKLLGGPVPNGHWGGELGVNDAICQMNHARSGLARLIYKILTNMKEKSEAKGKPDLNILFIYNMPFRGIAKMTGGAVSMDMVRGMVLVVNGHFFKGLGKIISGYFANSKANKAYEAKLK